MPYAQWVTITIAPKGFTTSIKKAKLSWGKFYKCPNKDKEVSTSTINKVKIPSGESYEICSCGREDAASGTEGSLAIYDGDTHVGTYYWDCPWGSKTNTSTWTPNPSAEDYVGGATGGNLDSGALGNVTLKVGKF